MKRMTLQTFVDGKVVQEMSVNEWQVVVFYVDGVAQWKYTPALSLSDLSHDDLVAELYRRSRLKNGAST